MIIVLVVGVILGYAARDLPIGALSGQSGETNTASVTSATETVSTQPSRPVGSASPEDEPPSVHAFPATETLLDYILPERALAQLRISVDRIRKDTSHVC